MMMYFRKVSNYVLAAGLTALINSCTGPHHPELELVSLKVFEHYPSASAIEFDEGRVYVFGDDAPHMLVLDTAFNAIDSVQYIDDTSYRQPKDIKKDIESVTICKLQNKKLLYAMGSFSAEHRKSIFIFDLANVHKFSEWSHLSAFPNDNHILEWNIEGLCMVNNSLVMSNRANTTHRTNQFIISNNFISEDSIEKLHVIDVSLSLQTVAGISELYYYPSKDILFFTASEEDTPSATEDGVISNSYIGWFENFSGKINDSVIKPDGLMNLSNADRKFVKQKIESVCLENVVNNEYDLFLAADNDNGQSTLYKVRLRL